MTKIPISITLVINTLIYLIPLAAILSFFYWRSGQRTAASLARDAVAHALKLKLPNSLHPYIDHSKCLGCGSCANACPEGDVIGLINGKAHLIEGANCIGHGACAAACPFDAITLVFGTSERGVELPDLSEQFETSRTGVYVAGELGGMGLIRNAILQGTQAVDAIGKRISETTRSTAGNYDIIIVGAGPAGIAASLQAKKLGLSTIILEQSAQFGGTVANFPRHKVVMTSPVMLPLHGKLNFTEVSKESLIDIFTQVIETQDLNVTYQQKMQGIEGEFGAYTVHTDNDSFQGCCVLLCMGRRGTPRKLGVAGEEQAKVTYSLIDPSQYEAQHILVVGGGDSALEAAHSLCQQDNTTVTLSYRNDNFGRAKPANREKIATAESAGHITVLLNSQVTEITEDTVVISHNKQLQTIKNDTVIVCAGGELPTPLLQRNNIAITTKFGEV